MADFSNISTTTSEPVSIPTLKPLEEGGLVFVVLSSLLTCLWAIYITFYHSRMMGLILTWLINLKYIENGQYFKIGEFVDIVVRLQDKCSFSKSFHFGKMLTFKATCTTCIPSCGNPHLYL